MSFLLDTNIASAHLKRPRGLIQRFIQHSGLLYISTVSLAELYVWVNQASDPESRVQAVERMLQHEVRALPFDEACAQRFGQLRFTLRRVGVTVNAVDLLIASGALAYDMTLVTHNTKHFASIPDLRLEDWLQD
jgi:predicted nucleic acid-binding protein